MLREANAELADSNFELIERNKKLNDIIFDRETIGNKKMAIELSTLKQKINNFLFEINQGSVKHE